MFTGLVEHVGQIRSLVKHGDGLSLTIEAQHIVQNMAVGDSVAVDGVCLTVVHCTSSDFSVDAVGETVSRSTLQTKSVHARVNLERALLAGGRLGGHFVQGHVDGLGQITSIQKRDPGYWLEVRLPDQLVPFVVEKGSIALDGTSLTIAHIDVPVVSLAIIPHTWKTTTLQDKKVGDTMNVEVDILAKYVRNFLQPHKTSDGLTLERLTELGY
ncbi:riboflavin synthase [candidate division KSB1 bacterium]|nr:riboflavin synthase [candidate division KSB1 bacterium]RQW01205.1 MAG: riboflavin synthase [candidate division KSB1 bacterium]